MFGKTVRIYCLLVHMMT